MVNLQLQRRQSLSQQHNMSPRVEESLTQGQEQQKPLSQPTSQVIGLVNRNASRERKTEAKRLVK